MDLAVAYLIGGAATALAFVVIETRWPSAQFRGTYPGGRAYLSWLVWCGAGFLGLVWPLFWLCVFPEILHDRAGQADGRRLPRPPQA